MSDASEAITEEEIASLEVCESEQQWNAACDQIKKARGGQYPFDWWPKVVQSGLMDNTLKKFGGSSKITIREI